MHYDSFGNGVFRNPAIVKLDGSIIEPNTKMSELDIVTLNKMYPCENSCDQKNGKGEAKRSKFERLIHFQTISCYPKSAILKRKFKSVVKM